MYKVIWSRDGVSIDERTPRFLMTLFAINGIEGGIYDYDYDDGVIIIIAINDYDYDYDDEDDVNCH